MERPAPNESDADDELVRRAQAGDRTAFEALAGRYRAAVLAMAFARIGSREEADDLTQEILFRAWRHVGCLEEPAAFPGWLKAIAANACRSWFRKFRLDCKPLHACEEAASLRDPRPSPMEMVLAKERERAWRKALLSLPEANRLALLMHIWGGCSYDEIAAFAGVPLTTVEGRIHRARRQMRRVLNSSAYAELLGEPRRLWQQSEKETP